MTTVYDIDLFMSGWAKKELSEEWDNDGVMLCGDLKKPVEKLLVCLEINKKAVNDAIAHKCDLIITHHPFIFRPLKNICGTDFELASLLISGGVSVLSYHTRLDAAQDGVNDTLAKILELSDTESFAGFGRAGLLPREMEAEEFLGYVKEKLSCQSLRTSRRDGIGKIKKVAVVGGAGKDFLADAAKIADAYITGDLSHNAFITANECSLLAVDAGHYHTENPVVRTVAEKLSEKFSDIGIFVSDSLCPFNNF